MIEQFFWINKYGDAIYIGYGMEKVKELKIELPDKKDLEPLISVQYVSEDFINSIILLEDLNNTVYVFEELDYPESNTISKSCHESDFKKFKELIAEKNKQDKELSYLNIILENYDLIKQVDKNNNINPIKKNKI